MANNPGLQQLSIPNKQMGQFEPLSSNLGSQQLSITTNQTALMEPMSNNMRSQLLSIPNKGVAQMEHMTNYPGLQHLSAPNKRTVLMESVSRKQGSPQLSVPNKRTVHIESPSTKSGSQQLAIPKKRTAQMEPSPKGQTESFESVRAKLRESLAASLALSSQQHSKLESVGTTSQSEAASTPRQAHEGSQLAESISATVDVAPCDMPEGHLETLSSKDHVCAEKHNDNQSSSQKILTNENTEDSMKTWKCDGQEFQLKDILPDEDISFRNSFFIKDELLQGNGLYWADNDVEVVETMEGHSVKRPKLVHEEVSGDGGETTSQSLQTLAIKIEAELFKLFGGVNKKYKEKGRSLLFNLKDRNNPELRERVMSGEISPERLCSMSAEELASKELSDWRIAKAEEFAQMVVLPDSEVDIRRLVRKTHKGEFQVEFEQDDSVSVELAVGASSLSQIRSKSNDADAQLPSKADESETSEVAVTRDKRIPEDHGLQSDLTTQHDGNDLMQGLVVEELKDTEFLPSIVSLDEFMESLDSEPPFENLPADTGQAAPTSDENKSSDVGAKDSSDLGSIDPTDTALNKFNNNDVKYARTDINMKSADIGINSETSHPGGKSKGEHVWEGLLQLNISDMVMVVGFFKSGEKTSTKEWPSLLEIKGRVRLDAFEKFLQELPMSRSRATMVVHFCWKEGSPESGRVNLCEVADSYVMDERVGLAEPAPGVELYFCPLHARTFEMLGKYLPKDQTDAFNATDNGLIGIVVWRKANVTYTISPNSSSHHKHNSKKQQNTLRRQQEKDTSVNASSEPPLPLDPPPSFPEPPPDDEPIDDVPPGFGPAAARDEDDLPEFDFVRSSKPPVSQFSALHSSQGAGMAPFQPPARPPPRPVEQMRALIHKYGQNEMNANSVKWQHSLSVGVEVQPWNDDDDIPEWQPQPPLQQLPPPPPVPPVHSFQHPIPLPQIVNQQHLVSMPLQQPPHHPSQPLLPRAAPLPMLLQPLQRPMNMMQGQGQGQQTLAPAWQQGAMWAPPGSHGLSVQGNGLMQPSFYGGQPSEGQFYGTPGFGAMQNWRQDASKS